MAGYITEVTYTGASLATTYNASLPDDKKSLVQHFPYTRPGGVMTLDTWDNVRAGVEINGSETRWCVIAVSEATAGTEYYADDIPPVPEPEITPHPVDPTFKANTGTNAATLLANLQDPEFYNFVQRFKQLTEAEIEADNDFKNVRDCENYLRELSWP